VTPRGGQAGGAVICWSRQHLISHFRRRARQLCSRPSRRLRFDLEILDAHKLAAGVDAPLATRAASAEEAQSIAESPRGAKKRG